MQFAVSAQTTILPLRYRRRVAFRNSRIRMDVAGYANYERWWFLGWDITVEWGIYHQSRPQWHYRRAQATK